jgi:hypothetical protein
VILSEFPARGAARVRLVSALDVAHALARELDLDTGLLPPDVLWWARRSSGVRVAVWREPRVWTVRLRERWDALPRRLRLPMPGLVFLCLPGGQPPYVFAATRRPRSLEDELSHCPTYNTHDSGRVCAGSQVFPRDPSGVPEAFFRSFFAPSLGAGKSRRHPDDVGQLWVELRGQRAFPIEDLVPHLRVADALRIGE